MRKLSNSEMKSYFLGWQCRLRQLSAREYGGAPLPGMRPRVVSKTGEELMSAMTVLILPEAPDASTAYLKFQGQKSNEASKVYEAGVKYLAESYFQERAARADLPKAVEVLKRAGVGNPPVKDDEFGRSTA